MKSGITQRSRTTAPVTVRHGQQAPGRASRSAFTGLPRYLGGGQPLPEPTRSKLEAGFGQRLGHIRMHQDARAAWMSDALDADAFTLGSRIFLGAGRSPMQLELMAHEVAHALQQSGAQAGGMSDASRPGDATEKAADRAARHVARGLPTHPGPSTGVQLARQPRSGAGSGLSEEQLEDLAAIGEAPSPFLGLSTGPSYETQLARYQRGQARQRVREADDQRRIESEQATWNAQVLHDQIEDATNIDSVSDVTRAVMGGLRWNQANIRQGGEDLEQWLQDSQKKSTAQAYAQADQHNDDWYGPLLRANAVFHDMSSEFSTGFVRGGVTLGSGLLGAVANPVDTTSGLLELGNDLVNPFADKKELNAAVEGVTKPYVQAVGEGRYLEAGGRLVFDLGSMLLGGEAATGTKTARGATVVDDLARTLPAGDDLARTLPAGDDLARTVPAGDDLARTLPAGDDLARTAPAADDLARTQPARPFPTGMMPGALPEVFNRQLLKFNQWMDAFYRPLSPKLPTTRPVPVGAGEVQAAAQARAPIVTHLSESFHRNIWESIGGKGEPPVAFRHNESLFVDYERLPPALRSAVDEAKQARSPGAW